MSDITLDFVGPLTFTEGAKSIFHAPNAKSPGVYLWTIRQRDESHLINYVGETKKSLASRHREHLIGLLGLDYDIIDAEKGQDGICEMVWKGLGREKNGTSAFEAIEAYQRVHGSVMSYLSALNIFFAELSIEDRLRKHIEGCIGWNFRKKHPESTALYPMNRQVGAMQDREHGNLLISASEPIRGLDERIPY